MSVLHVGGTAVSYHSFHPAASQLLRAEWECLGLEVKSGLEGQYTLDSCAVAHVHKNTDPK